VVGRPWLGHALDSPRAGLPFDRQCLAVSRVWHLTSIFFDHFLMNEKGLSKEVINSLLLP
jgi:hypothetical protein